MNRQTEQEKNAPACTEEKDQAGQLQATLLQMHPRMVYGNPDDFFLELLMEQEEQQ